LAFAINFTRQSQLSRRLSLNHEIVEERASAPGPGGYRWYARRTLREGKTGPKTKRSRGSRRLRSTRRLLCKSPASRCHGTFFTSPEGKGAGLSSGTPRGVPHCFSCKAGIYRRFRQSAPSRPFENFGSTAGSCSGPKQVTVKSRPEGDPALIRVRLAASPSPFLPVLGLDYLANLF
jgi:hypothetical protein